jgi:hypothetical protein
MSEFHGSYDPADFSADLHFTGENVLLSVRGAGTFPTPACVLSITYGNQGINPDPEVVMLDVHDEDEAGMFPQVETKIWAEAIFDLRLTPKVVVFRIPDAEDIRVELTTSG